MANMRKNQGKLKLAKISPFSVILSKTNHSAAMDNQPISREEDENPKQLQSERQSCLAPVKIGGSKGL